MSPHISVITPCFNAAQTIGDTLDSVIAQHYTDMEHIIIDGASTDRTPDILREYADLAPYPVTVISEPDDGIYDAMNKGIRRASGDLIGIINADDRYVDGAFDIILCSADTDCIVYGMIEIYDMEKLRSIEFYHHDFLRQRMINHPGCFISRSVYDRVGLYNTEYRSSADYEWMMRASESQVTFIPVYDVLARVRTGGMSSTNVGFRETLKLQHKWGQISGARYAAYTLKSYIGDALKK